VGRDTKRVLCIDSVGRHLSALKDLLENRGFDAWAARNIGDAEALISGLAFDAVLVDQASARSERRSWELLTRTQPSLPVLVHSASTNDVGSLGQLGEVRTESPEVILAILTLLLGPDKTQTGFSVN
jgi:hypothetical protein